MQTIDGKKIAKEIEEQAAAAIGRAGFVPRLAVILVGNDPASHLYVSLKEKMCARIGIAFEKNVLPESSSTQEVIAAVEVFNSRSDVDAILIQLPLPSGLDTDAVIRTMDPAKDVDGFHPENIKRFQNDPTTMPPVLVRAIQTLIASTGEKLGGKQAVIFANSTVFAEPLAAGLTAQGVRPTTVLASHISNPAELSGNADITIIAVGKPKFLRAKDAKDGAIIIDVGTNHLPDGSYTGDVDRSDFENKPGWITPVPGGVGPVTVATISENVLALAEARRG